MYSLVYVFSNNHFYCTLLQSYTKPGFHSQTNQLLFIQSLPASLVKSIGNRYNCSIMKNIGRWLQRLRSSGNELISWLGQHIGICIFCLISLVLIVVLSAGQAGESPIGTPSPESDEAAFIEKVNTLTPQATSTPEPTLPNETRTPTPTPTPTEIVDYGIVWSTGFESGSLKDYVDAASGEFIYQSDYASYKIVNYPVLNGNHATALTIDTQSLAIGKAAGAYLFYYVNPDAAWYSAWILIPEDTQPISWWNIWQWKSTSGGNSNQSVPMWILSLSTIPNRDDLQMGLVFRPDNIALRYSYHHPSATINKGEWVHISTYYQKSMDSDGVVGVFINGEAVFWVENVQTTESDNSLYWSINHYAEAVLPHPSTIYVDDVIISNERIDPFFRLP